MKRYGKEEVRENVVLDDTEKVYTSYAHFYISTMICTSYAHMIYTTYESWGLGPSVISEIEENIH